MWRQGTEVDTYACVVRHIYIRLVSTPIYAHVETGHRGRHWYTQSPMYMPHASACGCLTTCIRTKVMPMCICICICHVYMHMSRVYGYGYVYMNVYMHTHTGDADVETAQVDSAGRRIFSKARRPRTAPTHSTHAQHPFTAPTHSTHSLSHALTHTSFHPPTLTLTL